MSDHPLGHRCNARYENGADERPEYCDLPPGHRTQHLSVRFGASEITELRWGVEVPDGALP